MTSVALSSIAGVLLSLLFSYVPGLNTWYAKLASEYKRLLMLGLLLVVALGVYGVSCLGWFATGVTCDKAGALALLQAFAMAAIANQTAYSLSPQTAATKEARREGKYSRGDDL